MRKKEHFTADYTKACRIACCSQVLKSIDEPVRARLVVASLNKTTSTAITPIT